MAFRMLGGATEELFEEWFDRVDPTHEQLVSFVMHPQTACHSACAGRCPLCRFPVASLDVADDAPDGVLAIVGDVSRSEDVDVAVRRVEEELGPVSVLVCSAGVPAPSSSPARRLRLPGARIVAVRSPTPASPEKLSELAPRAWA